MDNWEIVPFSLCTSPLNRVAIYSVFMCGKLSQLVPLNLTGSDREVWYYSLSAFIVDSLEYIVVGIIFTSRFRKGNKSKAHE